MALREHRVETSGPCVCCGEVTTSTTGIADIGLEPAPIYVTRWNPRAKEQGVVILIGLGDPRGFVAARYDIERDGISIIGPDDYDWHSDSLRVLQRSQVIGTPLAEKAFAVIDEIWAHDSELQSFLDKCNSANKPW